MKNRFLWNIKRKGIYYFVSIGCMLSTLCMSSVMQLGIFTGKDLIPWLSRWGVASGLIKIGLYLVIGLLIVIIIHMLTGFLFYSNRFLQNRFRHQFVIHPCFIIDVLILLFLGFLGIYSVFQTDLMDSHYASIQRMGIYLICIPILGIIMNAYCVFPFLKYRSIRSRLADASFLDKSWAVLSNSKNRYSFSSLFPRIKEDNYAVYSLNELNRLEKSYDMSVELFYKLLVVFDNGASDAGFLKTLELVSKSFYQTCLVLVRDEKAEEQHQDEINLMKYRMNARVVVCHDLPRSVEDLNPYIKEINAYTNLVDLDFRNLLIRCPGVKKCLQTVCDMPKEVQKLMQFSINPISSKTDKKVYSGQLEQGTAVLKNLMEMEFRMLLPFAVHVDKQWLKKNTSFVKSLNKMSNTVFTYILGNNLEHEYLSSKDYFTDKHMGFVNQIIGTPWRWAKDDDLFDVDNLSDMASILRNKISGHSFTKQDEKMVFEIYFIVALVMAYLLKLNQFCLSHVDDIHILGEWQNVHKDLDLFYRYDKKSDFYVMFDEYRDDADEAVYINYITGDHIVPSYETHDLS